MTFFSLEQVEENSLRICCSGWFGKVDRCHLSFIFMAYHCLLNFWNHINWYMDHVKWLFRNNLCLVNVDGWQFKILAKFIDQHTFELGSFLQIMDRVFGWSIDFFVSENWSVGTRHDAIKLIELLNKGFSFIILILEALGCWWWLSHHFTETHWLHFIHSLCIRTITPCLRSNWILEHWGILTSFNGILLVKTMFSLLERVLIFSYLLVL